MTKKLSRRRVLPTVIEPNWPQSTWAHSPGAKASVRKAGLRGGRTSLTYCLTMLMPPLYPAWRNCWKIWAEV